MAPDLFLASALALYAVGTSLTLASLSNRRLALQRGGTIAMAIGILPHTIWIGTICARTGHPPLTNLPETAAFLSWTLLLAQLVLGQRFRLSAAGFFIYPLTLILLTVSALIGERVAPLDPELQSNVFIAHLFLSTVGVAALFLGLAFTALYRIQERSLKTNRRGPLFDWIPSLRICDLVSFRSLTTGFLIYTFGLLAGFVWLLRDPSIRSSFGVKEVGAIAAWVLFAVLIQSHRKGTIRRPETLYISAGAFVAIIAAIFGIQHV